ncbi:MAG TPA: hypothetical protein PLJ58_02610 [bacterium]|nr:hypothetical protein [bacterium]
MKQLATCCLFVLAMGLPCLGQDSLVQMQHNNHLISLDISGDQMTASGRAQILAKPLSFSEHWGAINDISLTFEHETHFYCLVGCSFSAQITEKTELEISLSAGCAYQKRPLEPSHSNAVVLATGANMRISSRYLGSRNLIVELEIKKQGDELWYLGKLSIESLALFGSYLELGIRAEEHSIAGPQIQICFQQSKVVELGYWLAYGYNHDTASSGAALGLSIKSLF